MEASGVKLEFAANNEIFTVGIKAHNYNRGNFFTPTRFTARIGPFAPDTLFLGRVMALDTVGDVAYSNVTVLKVPHDAKAIKAPPAPVSPFINKGGGYFYAIVWR
jgi:hypothetical protein